MKLNELITESQLPKVGRKYQHIEDLVFTEGSKGGLHAIERLKHIATEDSNLELKWDGSPVLFWGRDSSGKFSMITKNAWDYAKRGKQISINSPIDLKEFILNTGSPSLTREAYADRVASLWPYLEQASPVTGYVEGSVLFDHTHPAQLKESTNEYEFTPNITTFHIPANSELGARIKKSKIMVAVTGFYESIGSITECRYPDAGRLSTDDVIVQGTTYAEKLENINTLSMDLTQRLIEEQANIIDEFLKPVTGLSKPGEILYKFFNQNLRLPGVRHKFQEWAIANLSAGQAQKILNKPGLNTVLGIVEKLTQEKMNIIEVLSNTTHRGIRQTKPEGYAQAYPGQKFKNDLPGQFIKIIDQSTWSPRK